MIRKIQYLVLVSILLGCTSSTSEEKGDTANKTKTPSLEEKSENDFIPNEIAMNITGKKRGALNKLYADGSAWFSFRITETFEELKIDLKGKQLSYSMTWNTEAEDGNENPLPLQSVNQGDFIVDVVLTPGLIRVFFNEGLETFSFKSESQAVDASVEVYLDGKLYSVPGILYAIQD